MDAVRRFCLLLCMSLSTFSVCAEKLSKAESRFNELHEVMIRTARDLESVQAQAMAQEFDRLYGQSFSKKQIQKTPTADLGFLLRAAELAAFYSVSDRDVANLERVLDELKERHADKDEHWLSYYKSLISVRNFEAARPIVASRPGLNLEAIPTIFRSGKVKDHARYWEVAEDAHVLREKSLDVGSGIRLIVVAHALCHFSKEAMETLAADPELADVISKRTIWLAPIDRAIYFKELQTWNRDHPLTKLILADNKADWPFIDSWATPTFYLIRDGHLIGSFSGWAPGVGNRPELVALLRRGGLLVADAHGRMGSAD